MISRRKSISWRPQESHAFESAWSIAHKFCRWNTARFAEFWTLVSANTNRCPPLKRCYMRDASWIDRKKFAGAFRLDERAARNAFADRYAADVPLTACLVRESEVRLCPRCAANGFHSHFYDLLFVSRCPIHSEALRSDCPNCGRPISSEVTRAAEKDPYACPCGYIFWPVLRSCAFSVDEAARLRDAIAWLDEISPRLIAAIREYRVREKSCGEPVGPIINAAVRCIAELTPDPAPFIAREYKE